MHSAVRNVMRLFDRIKDFEKRVLAREPELNAANREALLEALGAARADARAVRPAPRRGAVARVRQRGARRTDAVARRIVRGARMSTQTAQSPGRVRQRTRSCATGLACHRCEQQLRRSRRRSSPARTAARASTSSTTTSSPHATSARSPARGAPARTSGTSRSCCRSSTPRAQARVGQHSGYTPLIRADRLGAELGIANLYLKDDSTSRPSFSYKDRVVSMSVARLLERGRHRDRLRLDRQRRHRGRLARRQGRRGRLRLLPEPPRGHEGARRAWRSARRSARWRATTTKPTAAAAKSPKRRAWTSRTSRCARSTPRAPRRRRSRSSSSSTGTRPTTSSPPPPAARSPRACTRG